MPNPIDLCQLSDVRPWLSLDGQGQPVTSVQLLAGGTGYPNSFSVTVTPVDGNGSGAVINGTAVGGVVQSLTLVPNGPPGTNGSSAGSGKGYTQAPLLSFPTGTGASAVAYIGQDPILARLITAASSFMLVETNRAGFGPATFTDARNGTGSRQMVMLQNPVISVSAVTIFGVPVQPSTYTGNGQTAGYVFDETTVYLVGDGRCFPKGQQNVSFTYSAGFSVVPYDISQAVIEAVCQKFRRRSHIDQDSQSLNGQETISFSKSDFPKEVNRVIRNYKISIPY